MSCAARQTSISGITHPPQPRPTRVTKVGIAANSRNIDSDMMPGLVTKLARCSPRDNRSKECLALLHNHTMWHRDKSGRNLQRSVQKVRSMSRISLVVECAGIKATEGRRRKRWKAGNSIYGLRSTASDTTFAAL